MDSILGRAELGGVLRSHYTLRRAALIQSFYLICADLATCLIYLVALNSVAGLILGEAAANSCSE